ncbi:MAG: hypothetical protein GY847_13270 [Proteobacteria bacterium]|nr:hypothetical protein [Pseudomonadota bacterium]
MDGVGAAVLDGVGAAAVLDSVGAMAVLDGVVVAVDGVGTEVLDGVGAAVAAKLADNGIVHSLITLFPMH